MKTMLIDSLDSLGKYKYKYIILDLDESLVYTSNNKKGNGEKMKYKDVHGDNCESWVHKRPGFDLFLKTCFENSKVGVWSMGQPNYVQSIVKLFPQAPDFVFNWCHCDRKPGGKIYKNLSSAPFVSITDEPILMIDDNVSLVEPTSGVDIFCIPRWHPRDANDTVLYKLVDKLYSS